MAITICERRVCAGYRDGQRCRAVPVAGLPADLCAEHAEALRRHWQPERPEVAGGDIATVRERIRLFRTSIVYYVRFGDRIKIGWTTELRTRLQSIPYDALLAVEPGGKDVEQARHRQFRALSLGREWFRDAEPLTSHVAMLAATGSKIPVAGLLEPIDVPEDAMLTVPEVAAALGIDPRTVRAWIARGFLGQTGLGTDGRPLYRFGDAIRAIPKGSKHAGLRHLVTAS
ncbi:MAG: hypothetical protein M0030_25980 [Actinomycetota bacterium]|nr:hypothetical protein [Actinomycetota bacterium]